MMRLVIAAFAAWLAWAPLALANDYPTLARVEYVMSCMNRIGAQTYDTMYRCVCSIDQIAERLSYSDYAEAQTFSYLKSTPGERGGVFRDPPRSRELTDALTEAEGDAANSCFLN